jgi:hypothetical protein
VATVAISDEDGLPLDDCVNRSSPRGSSLG